MKNQTIFFLFLMIATVVSFTACEEEFTPEIASEPLDIVVEGFVEAGPNPTPTYVLLTRSFSFYSEFGADELDQGFVNDAIVEVTVDGNTFTLPELCLNDLAPEEREVAAELLGFDPDSIMINFCIYIDLFNAIAPEAGKTYDLNIEVEDKILTASTTIPEYVPLDSLRFQQPPGEPSDTLRELRCLIQDPEITNYYRYLTQINGEGFVPGFNSVTDDRFFNGQAFEFPLQKGEPRNGEFDQTTFGLYEVGDTATIKWCVIDEAHYKFWSTLEFNAVNQGPFSSYTRIETNIEGGIGIWGGLSAEYYTRVVTE